MTPHVASCRRRAPALPLLVLLAACGGAERPSTEADTAASAVMGPREFQALPHRAADRRLAYGADSSQYGELRLPSSTGPHPVVVLIHGGCFKAAYAKVGELGAIGDTLRSRGIATWDVEYRRLGQPGGGWPGTYQDVGRAVDYLRVMAREYDLDLGRVVIVGHSAGGHLAMWAAARSRLPRTSPLFVSEPLPVRGVVDMAGPLDLAADVRGYESTCGDSVITALLGGSPESVPERYAQTSIPSLLPLGVLQVLVWGTKENFVPRPLADAYVRAATSAGDSVRLVPIPGAGHFEIAAPSAPSWPAVERAVLALVDGHLP